MRNQTARVLLVNYMCIRAHLIHSCHIVHLQNTRITHRRITLRPDDYVDRNMLAAGGNSVMRHNLAELTSTHHSRTRTSVCICVSLGYDITMHNSMAMLNGLAHRH